MRSGLIVDGGLSSVGKGRLFMVELALVMSLLVLFKFYRYFM